MSIDVDYWGAESGEAMTAPHQAMSAPVGAVWM